MPEHKLFMLYLGCKPAGRNTEQHDIFFGIAKSLKELIPDIISYWPEAKGNIHIDAWREVTNVDDYEIQIVPRQGNFPGAEQENKLFFINLVGYKQNEFDEFHYKVLVTSVGKSGAIKKSKETAFYKHVGYKTAESHIDDKYGVDVDDAHAISDILPQQFRNEFSIKLQPAMNQVEDKIHLGYFRLDKL